MIIQIVETFVFYFNCFHVRRSLSGRAPHVCNVSQYVATCCNTLQHTTCVCATYRSTLHSGATHCNAATKCNTLQHIAYSFDSLSGRIHLSSLTQYLLVHQPVPNCRLPSCSCCCCCSSFIFSFSFSFRSFTFVSSTPVRPFCCNSCSSMRHCCGGQQLQIMLYGCAQLLLC